MWLRVACVEEKRLIINKINLISQCYEVIGYGRFDKVEQMR